MTYENAKATKILATHCCACGRPLVDAVSVELGIGPDCRKKYMPAKLGGPAREEANRLVYRLALQVSINNGLVVDDAAKAAFMLGGPQAVGAMLVADTAAEPMLARLRELGFEKLADKLEQAWITIKITRAGDELLVEAPFNERALPAWRNLGPWDGVKKVRKVAGHRGQALMDVLIDFYPGQAGISDKGPFVVPTSKAHHQAAVVRTQILAAAQRMEAEAEAAKRQRIADGARAAAVALRKAHEDGAMLAERDMQMMEANADRAQTLADEAAKFAARQMMEAA